MTLSGGQKQRTAIAATLAMRPRILVLDEPLSDLDPVGCAGSTRHAAQARADEGTGVLIIEHRVDEVAPWADRVVLMDGGRIVLDEPPRAAWADQASWAGIGVGVPDMVRLAHALPRRFHRPASAVGRRGAQPGSRDLAGPALAQAATARRVSARPARGTEPRRPPPAATPVLAWDHVTVDFAAKRA